ncbi:beta-ketoacyl synthase chain length factor [Aliamphritea spongicola]|uniref:beta-ketoacyl synthase chain length factor n=1 Tax=Aliamphritea spongicola TaxID=707589 RepID=UPI00196AF732|nr:beta-ketoacyl synthase chain length factor [Aliamphritea spongicola]MBN3564442.1 beta-ketoacyl synthase chain length factor [Aliamphritea spongicola]
MLRFNIDAWNAYAPGLEDCDAWQAWLNTPFVPDDSVKPAVMKAIPAMLRRRFTPLGKVAMGAALPLLTEMTSVASVFASRHGDTPLTLELLKGIGQDDPMSPTAFSLAVHNAVGGLYSIARKDKSAINAIAASEGLVVQALLEAACLLQEHSQVLCVIYDVVLPELYRPYCNGPEFPHALALMISSDGDNAFELQQLPATGDGDDGSQGILRMISLLSGCSDEFDSVVRGSRWQLNPVKV